MKYRKTKNNIPLIIRSAGIKNKQVQISPQEQEANNKHFCNDRGKGEQRWDIGYQHSRENRSYDKQSSSVNSHSCSSSMKMPSFSGKYE
ncbi:hypothetical protein DPMN_017935 [Dreissena polymorpha]|uniref:Uncharacterized protein n=1 Tax=Dreissena polymorpha TaxID=45954 RepID=A0A9D4NHH2_DREPO|nr:hypothetical protein DPMN_017935 [Dreissena polymorpha]